MTKRRKGRIYVETDRIHIPTEGNQPLGVRDALLADVRARMEAGEFDSETALVETALALLDGDVYPR